MSCPHKNKTVIGDREDGGKDYRCDDCGQLCSTTAGYELVSWYEGRHLRLSDHEASV